MPDADRDAFDEVDEALHLGRLLLAVLTAHGCGCVHCAKAWDALDEYPEFAGDASCRPIGFNPMRHIDGDPRG